MNEMNDALKHRIYARRAQREKQIKKNIGIVSTSHEIRKFVALQRSRGNCGRFTSYEEENNINLEATGEVRAKIKLLLEEDNNSES